MYLRIRTGSDVAYFGGLINHVLQNNLFHDEYVRNYTNASFLVKDGYAFTDGLFSGYSASARSYNIASWSYDTDPATSFAKSRASPASRWRTSTRSPTWSARWASPTR